MLSVLDVSLLYSERQLLSFLVHAPLRATGYPRSALLPLVNGDPERLRQLIQVGWLEEEGERLLLSTALRQWLEPGGGAQPDPPADAWQQGWQAFTAEPNAARAVERLRELAAQAGRLSSSVAGRAALAAVLRQWDRHPQVLRLQRDPRWQRRLQRDEQRLRQAASGQSEVNEAQAPWVAHLRWLRAQRAQHTLRSHTSFSSVVQAEPSLWLAGKLPLQPRVALSDLPGLRLPRRRGAAASARSPVPLAGDLPETEGAAWSEDWRVAFRQSGQDLLGFLRQKSQDEAVIQDWFLRLSVAWGDWLSPEPQMVSFAGKNWAVLRPLP